jgi:polyphosphate kinase
MAKASVASPPLNDPGLYTNRELSLLEFQRRVFAEACDESNPLLERVKFLSILSSNLDEFFMVRFAGLRQQVESGVTELSIDGRTPAAVTEAIRIEVNALVAEVYEFWEKTLSPELRKAGIHI